LAYRKNAPVNFCPKDLTVLADEQVIDGKCERCGSEVEKRNLTQWFFQITHYSERLLKNIPGLDWTEKVKIAQTNWIGKKEGIEITYPVEHSSETVTVFTTRPDTNFGATFIALAPENPLVEKLTTPENKKVVEEYIAAAKLKSDVERETEGKEKTGVFTGSYAINHLTGFKMPIWVSDFVLMGFGTGALVGVPAHDLRDFHFAAKFGLAIKRVVVGKDGDTSDITDEKQVQEEEGVMINSDFLDGMDIHDATKKIIDYISEKGWGKRVTTYHLRDWLISRQRYWGPPIPLVFCEACAAKGICYEMNELGESKGLIAREESNMAGWFPVPESDLPVLLPELEDWKPTADGKSPLARLTNWVNTTCPNCGAAATRETDVSDTFLDSAWYFLRYVSTDIENALFDMDRVKKWLPVTSYIGGAEHSVLHLLYSRFITMVLKDLGHLDFEEPFAKFRAHGLIIKDGAKMSKSKGNVINPDDYVKKYGADTLRCYLGFVGPFAQGGDFQDSGIEGLNKFLKRVWVMAQRTLGNYSEMTKERQFAMHKAIKKVSEEMPELRFNTSLAALMEWYNVLSKEETIAKEELENFIKMLAPFAPHITEEIWSEMQKNEKDYKSIHVSSWPVYKSEFLEKSSVTLVVQVNGKIRDSIDVSVDGLTEESAVSLAKESSKVQQWIANKKILKTIYVPQKIVNIVVA
ncbi:MAG TPA: class I tRNA ligase family protein, partial [Patescibacteria group bacterium]|nr:class I tRNA ligase family protein [Patescibacteria group bacterium]